MPAWWRGKSKSKPKSTSSPRAAAAAPPQLEEEEDATPKPGSGRRKEKDCIFDEAPVCGRSRDASSPISAGGGCGDGGGTGCVFGRPLPLPSRVASEHAAVAGSASVSASLSASSVSSTASSDETPDPGLRRHSDTISMLIGRSAAPNWASHQYQAEDRQITSHISVFDHPKFPENSVSTTRDFPAHGFDATSNGRSAYSHGQTSTETISGRRIHHFPTSPVYSRAFGLCPASPNQRQDNLRNPPHPLPLPPSSPTSSSSSSSSSSRSPKSQWKKGRLIGRGTFGHVYLGFNSESGQMCAVKEVKDISDDTNSKECLKQLSQEIALLSQLSHPNIVQYYGSELAEDTLSVYLEYVSGGSIHKLLQEYGPFREPLIRNYTAQILSGLSYLHERNTVHRDIKGANILVDPNGEIKLADFGMAKHISICTSLRSFKGSPYWMAPEVIMNGGGYNLSVDIWSLGCTVLEMATSKPPWSQYEGVAAIFKIGNSKDIPDIPDHISSEGMDFLRVCFQRDPMTRPSAAQLMDHPFVRDQLTAKATKFSAIRDSLPSFSSGNTKLMTVEISSSRSTSPLHDREYGTCPSGFPSVLPSSAYGNSRNLTSSRWMNMSLPVSPCSSPLRQFKQSYRSCLPSPPHPACSAGAANYSPLNNVLYPTGLSNNLSHPSSDISPNTIRLSKKIEHRFVNASGGN